jgi:hypothetical protein
MDICILEKKDPETIAKLNRDVQEKHLELFPNSFKEYDYLSILEAIKSFLEIEEYSSFIAYFNGNIDGSTSGHWRVCGLTFVRVFLPVFRLLRRDLWRKTPFQCPIQHDP